jgi:hypothetical protein
VPAQLLAVFLFISANVNPYLLVDLKIAYPTIPEINDPIIIQIFAEVMYTGSP